MPSINLSFRAHPSLLAHVSARDPKDLKNPGSIAKRDLERWYAVLAQARMYINLSPAEAVLLIRVANEVGEIDEEVVTFLVNYVRDHPQDGFAHVQGTLLQKVNRMDYITRWALMDAVDRYRVYQVKHPEATVGMALHQVGLHSYTATPEELAALESAAAGDLRPIGSED